MAGKGLRAASIYASLSLDTEEFAKGVRRALGDLEQFASKVEGIGSKLGGVGAAMAASLGASVAVAASQIAPLGSALDAMKDSGQALANEIGAQLVPTVEAMARGVASATRFIQSLDDDLKRVLASIAVWTTGGLLAAGMVGKLAAGVAGLSQAFQLVLKHAQPAFKALDKGFGALQVKGFAALVPVLAIAAGVATLVLAAGAVYRAWNDTSTGFADAVQSMLATVKGWVAQVGEAFGRVWDGVSSFVLRGVKLIADNIAAQVRLMAKAVLPIMELLGMDGASSFLSGAASLTGDDLLKGAKAAGGALLDGAKLAGGALVNVGMSVGGDIATSVKYAAGGVEAMFGDVLAKVKGMFPNLTGGTGTQRSRFEFDVGAASKTGSPDAKKFIDDAVKGVSTTMDAYKRMRIAAFEEEMEVRRDIERWTQEGLRRSAEAIRSAYDGLVSKFVSRTGEIASLAESAMQGAQAGGIWGALIAVVVDLLSRSEQFKAFAEQLNVMIQQISNTLGKVLAPIFAALTPILDVVTDTTAALAPILETFGEIIGGILGPVLKVVGSVIIALTRVVGVVWNGILEVIAAVVRIFDGEAADALLKRKMDMRALDEAERRLWAEREMADAAESVAEKLGDADDNIPSGWRRNLATYRSIDDGPVGMPPGSGGGGGGTIIIGEVHGANALEIADEIDAALRSRRERINNKLTGTRLTRTSPFGSDYP